jgi:hypothetical protein
LPAWAQLAAAAVIFAFGIALGTVVTRVPAWAVSSPSNEAAISHAELTRLEQRVRDIESKSAVPVTLDDASRHAVTTLVREQVYESELRNRARLAQVVAKFTGNGPQEQVGPSGYGPVEIGARFGQRREE